MTVNGRRWEEKSNGYWISGRTTVYNRNNIWVAADVITDKTINIQAINLQQALTIANGIPWSKVNVETKDEESIHTNRNPNRRVYYRDSNRLVVASSDESKRNRS